MIPSILKFTRTFFFQEAKGKGKRPAKRSKAGDHEPKSKKSKKDDDESEDLSKDDESEEDFLCAAPDK